MSGRKSQLPRYQIITNGDMSGNVTSASTNILYQDNLSIYLSFTGTPVGTFAVQASQDNSNWVGLALSATPVAAGGPDTILMDLNQVPFEYIRVVYTAGASTGTLNGYISAKQI